MKALTISLLIVNCVIIGILSFITSSILVFVIMLLCTLISFCIYYYVECDREGIIIDKEYYKTECEEYKKYICKSHKLINSYVKNQKDSNELINKLNEIIKLKDDVIDCQTKIITGIETINFSLMSVVKSWEDFHKKTVDNLRILDNDIHLNRSLYNNDITILTKNIKEYSEFCNKLISELRIINDKTKCEKDKLQCEIDKSEEK